MKRWNKLEKIKSINSRADLEMHSVAKGSEVWEGSLNRQRVERLVVYLRSSGCSFALANGGCTTCAHALNGTTLGVSISAKNYVNQFKKEYERQNPQRFPMVCIYNEGSMLFDSELPSAALCEILSIVRGYGVAKRIVLEARPEHVTPQSLSMIKESIGSKIEIEMGIGLESTNEFVRNTVMLKDTDLCLYEKSISTLREFGCKSLAYVLVKPPFLTEAESLADSVATVEYAFSVGTDAVSLEPVGVENFTLVQNLFDRGLYIPAKLWTVVAIVKKLTSLGEIRIGGQQFSPIPHTRPRTCNDGVCLDKMLFAIRNYNSTFDESILDGVHHHCQLEWYSKITNESKVIDVDQLVNKILLAVPTQVINTLSDSGTFSSMVSLSR